jgi:hypothetical protein
MALTNKQRDALAQLLLSRAGDLVESWDETTFEGVSQEAAAEQIARWLKGLPGKGWDGRLPHPPQSSRRLRNKGL